MEKIQLGRYRHYKGKEYKVLGEAKHSETLETMVVYQQLYGENGIWVRPKVMFHEMINIDGEERPRFEYLGD